MFASVGATAAQATAVCPNEALRTGRSAGLPDCRVYELVTPSDLGRSQDMTFTGYDHAVPSSDGEHMAIAALAPIGPSPSSTGARDVFSRTAEGWEIKSVVPPGAGAEGIQLRFFSPDLSQVALETQLTLNAEESVNAPKKYRVGAVGGPYGVVASIPAEYVGTSSLEGVNAGVTGGVPAFSDVLFGSTDHSLLPAGSERLLAEETLPGAYDLYDYTEGVARLVNVEGSGASLRLLNLCGATLGQYHERNEGPGAVGAVSADGSRIFFVTEASGPHCEEPSRLYMRVGGRETVEVSRPQGISVKSSERGPVIYDGATEDGSRVFFNTTTPLLAGEKPDERRLFEYDIGRPEGERLRLVTAGFGPYSPGRSVFFSGDGSTVYYMLGGSIFRYETATGKSSFVATAGAPRYLYEPSYATPDGEFLVFVSGSPPEFEGPHGLERESRGAVNKNELYRYDARDGSVMCVSCGEGNAPAEGEVSEPERNGGTGEQIIETANGIPSLAQMSENGQEVFFQSSAHLVPQDTNSTEYNQLSTTVPFPGVDVYEWEADGWDGCESSLGCTFLLSAGEDTGPSLFLGASLSGRDVFLSSAAQLQPQATPEFTNIYDVRVGGGFPAPKPVVECLSCQGVGSPPPLFSVPASAAFTGSGNPASSSAPSPATPAPPPGKKTVKCSKGRKLSHGRCLKVRAKRKRGRL